jgi:hypothetical protein
MYLALRPLKFKNIKLWLKLMFNSNSKSDSHSSSDLHSSSDSNSWLQVNNCFSCQQRFCQKLRNKVEFEKIIVDREKQRIFFLSKKSQIWDDLSVGGPHSKRILCISYQGLDFYTRYKVKIKWWPTPWGSNISLISTSGYHLVFRRVCIKSNTLILKKKTRSPTLVKMHC